MANDPEEIAETLRELARLDPVALGQQAVLESIVQAAATCCGSTGGVGLLLLNRDQQLCYVAAVGRPDAPWPVRSCDSVRAQPSPSYARPRERNGLWTEALQRPTLAPARQHKATPGT